MKNIEIKIPDNLTPTEEVVFIAKKMTQKALSGNHKNKEILRIGTGIEVKDLQTQITITRVSKEPVIEMVKCNMCGCEYQNTTAIYYWHNYGGIPKKRAVCSEECRNNVIELLPGRTATSRNKLKTIRLY